MKPSRLSTTECEGIYAQCTRKATAMPHLPQADPVDILPRCSYALEHGPRALEAREVQAQQPQQENKILQDWHVEWEKAERVQQPWTTHCTSCGTRRSSLLTRPAKINVHVHEKNIKHVELAYWGSDIDAPEGYLRQKEQELKAAQELLRKRFLSKHK